MTRPMNKFLVTLSGIFLLGCGYNDFDPLPGRSFHQSPGITITLNELAFLYDEDGFKDIPEGVVIGGVITNSDSTGNFYKSFIFQQDTTAVELLTGVYDNYVSFRRGQAITLEAGGLRLRRVNGTLQIGAPVEYSYIDYIQNDAALRRILHRTDADQTGTIEIPTVSIDDLQPCMAGRLVRLTGGEFTQGGAQTWGDEWYGDRTYSEKRGTSIRVYTSPYATFAGDLLPIGKVDLLGIVAMYNDRLQLRISSTDDVLPNQEYDTEWVFPRSIVE